MVQEEFKARAPEIIQKAVEFADLLDECDAEGWGDIIYIDDHEDMVDILLRLIASASCIALNLERWANKGQSEIAADQNARSPRRAAKLEMKAI